MTRIMAVRITDQKRPCLTSLTIMYGMRGINPPTKYAPPIVKAEMKSLEFGTSSRPSPNLRRKAVKPTSSENFSFDSDSSSSSVVRGFRASDCKIDCTKPSRRSICSSCECLLTSFSAFIRPTATLLHKLSSSPTQPSTSVTSRSSSPAHDRATLCLVVLFR